MAKLRTALPMLGSVKDAKKLAARFDDPSRTLCAERLVPPDEVRPAATDARTLLLRVANSLDRSEDIPTVVNTPAARYIITVEEFLDARIDHVVELTADALDGVIDAVDTLATYSLAAFSADGIDSSEVNIRLDGAATRKFTTAESVTVTVPVTAMR